ncbi:hypothetical protein D1007_51618 [Hordeum vulgare]|nr:hypothetical protein D1007_51618 [Hordeum vulgare]
MESITSQLPITNRASAIKDEALGGVRTLPVPISSLLCFLVDDPAAMDNGDNLVVYASVMLLEEVAYLQAKRAMHQAHERARATPGFFQNTLVVHPARFF